MSYELKDKITVDTELLNDLEIKCWQEIEHLQAQIDNLAEGPTNDRLRQLFKNLLTSYYVFTGGIETLSSEPINTSIEPIDQIDAEAKEPAKTESEIETDVAETSDVVDNFSIEDNQKYEVSDPFEYFVDFDEPVGEPLTDKDLYN